ncbi:peptide transporter PTR2-A [Lasiosphaeria hispida]|uniref:Peptide transporter PTR2-A n=1 Tax=Lasiosphaeria hispida TaxID=260671 RepID=A0AAJ0HPF0_9PEZI|nr:peptide transporter PTR2-A [Lasiosphaeria hispida]
MGNQPLQHEVRSPIEDEIAEVNLNSLRPVVDTLPLVVWVALAVSGAERFTFYAVTTPWQNYMQNAHDSIAVPGALGLGQATATNISSAFYFLTFLAPVPFAIISDAWLGRYKTLCLSIVLDFCGCLVLFITSLSFVESEATKIAGLAVGMILLGLGTGGVKATASPFIGDQYSIADPRLVVTKTGERVVVDRALTLQYIYNVFYWFTNIASLSLIASTYLERNVGFWAAYLMPVCSISVLLAFLLFWNKSFVKLAPQGNVLPKAGKVVQYAVRGRFRLNAARPAYQAEKWGRVVNWDDEFVSEIGRGLKACVVMACFVPFHLCMNQIANNLVSQAGQMQLGGVPNDMIQALNSIACILLGPLMQNMLYPSLRRIGIAFGPIARMTWAFVAMSTAMAYAAGVQKLIYSRGPCYDHPLACPDAAGGSVPNEINVWVQTPLYFLLAVAEILGFTTLSEYSYSEAPKNMRSLVQALGQLSSGVGSGLGMAVSPVSVDPQILWLYTGLAVAMVVVAPTFWWAFSRYDKANDQLAANSSDQTESSSSQINRVENTKTD